jgi:cyclase
MGSIANEATPRASGSSMRSRTVMIMLALLAGGAAAVIAQNFDKIEITNEKLADGVWMLKGAGGNLGLCDGPDGAILIDDQFAALTPKIQAAIKTLTDHPVRIIINTHWHGDHTGGNENFANAGAEIFAHENVRKRMSVQQIMPARNDTVAASPAKAWPVVTFADGVTLHLNGEDLSVIHVPAAHTDGDAFIWFHKANVIHCGDVLFNGFYPFIDTDTGGSIDGMIAADDQILAIANDQTKVIPGHGPLTDKAGLKRFRDMLVDFRGRIAKQMKAGKTADQMIAAHLTADIDSTWGKGFIKPDKFISMTVHDLTMHASAKK